MKKLNLTIQCMAVYNSSIDVPDEMGIDETAIYSMKKTATLDKTWLLWVGKDKAHCSSY